MSEADRGGFGESGIFTPLQPALEVILIKPLALGLLGATKEPPHSKNVVSVV